MMTDLKKIIVGEIYPTVGSLNGSLAPKMYYQVYDKAGFFAEAAKRLMKRDNNNAESVNRTLESIKKPYPAAEFYGLPPVDASAWEFMSYDKYGRSVCTDGVSHNSKYSLVVR